MNKLNCNIIKDLLPSYLDNICTNDSRKAVEEHLKTCKDCQAFAKMMMDTQLIAAQSDRREFDYMKKVRRRLITEGVLGLFLLLIVAVLGFTVFIRSYGGVPLIFYTIMLAVLLLTTDFLLAGRTHVRGTENVKHRMLFGVGVVLLCYVLLLSVVLSGNIFVFLEAGKSSVFGMPVSRLGPFFYYQYLISVFLQLLLYVIGVFGGYQTQNMCLYGSAVHLTGACLALGQISLLKMLTDIGSVRTDIIRTALVVLAEGVVLTLALRFVNKKHSSGVC